MYFFNFQNSYLMLCTYCTIRLYTKDFLFKNKAECTRYDFYSLSYLISQLRHSLLPTMNILHARLHQIYRRTYVYF